jgi:hypothetical protein
MAEKVVITYWRCRSGHQHHEEADADWCDTKLTATTEAVAESVEARHDRIRQLGMRIQDMRAAGVSFKDIGKALGMSGTNASISLKRYERLLELRTP